MTWIPVEERLPEDAEFVLAWSMRDRCIIGMYNAGLGWCNTFDADSSCGEITHWIPLPEPPA